MKGDEAGPKVVIHEVGLRDGLQNEPTPIPTEEKIALAKLLMDAGLPRIELTSFVSPKWIPQLADHKRVATEVPSREGVEFTALVPNLRGLEGALESGMKGIAIFMSASESHNQKNINKSMDEALSTLAEVASKAKEHALKIRGYLSVVFGCPYEGAVDAKQVLRLVKSLADLGVYEISLGDTIGVATPNQVRDTLSALFEGGIKPDQLALHMHDTRGTALANVSAGLDLGIRTFDSSFGGLGGCPYAPGASGNLATEDLVYLLDGMGFDSGVDLQKLIEASLRVKGLLGRDLTSKVFRAETARKAP